MNIARGLSLLPPVWALRLRKFKKYEEICGKYEENMKKYEGIMNIACELSLLPLYRLLGLENSRNMKKCEDIRRRSENM